MKPKFNLRPHIGWIIGGCIFWATIICLASLLTGCAEPMVFLKAGASKEQLAADSYDCDQQWERSAGAIAFRQDPIGNAYFGIKARGDKELCMQQKGWMRQ